MLTKDDTAKIEKVIMDALKDDFDHVVIRSVTVSRDDGSDEDVMRVEVVFDGTRKDLDVKKLTGTVRHVRPKLRAIGVEDFPLFSFVSRGDASGAKRRQAA